MHDWGWAGKHKIVHAGSIFSGIARRRRPAPFLALRGKQRRALIIGHRGAAVAPCCRVEKSRSVQRKLLLPLKGPTARLWLRRVGPRNGACFGRHAWRVGRGSATTACRDDARRRGRLQQRGVAFQPDAFAPDDRARERRGNLGTALRSTVVRPDEDGTDDGEVRRARSMSRSESAAHTKPPSIGVRWAHRRASELGVDAEASGAVL